jgi:hypothetical protein
MGCVISLIAELSLTHVYSSRAYTLVVYVVPLCISHSLTHLLSPSLPRVQFNCGEAVNFATSDWLGFARASNERYRRFARASVFSHDRLMLKLAQLQIEGTHSLSFGLQGCQALYGEVERMYREECKNRAAAMTEGIVQSVTMPPQSAVMDDAAQTYDERRCCLICKHACFFSATVCQCNPSAVACLRHRNEFCGCAPAQKCLILWWSESEIKQQLAGIPAAAKSAEDDHTVVVPAAEAPLAGGANEGSSAVAARSSSSA